MEIRARGITSEAPRLHNPQGWGSLKFRFTQILGHPPIVAEFGRIAIRVPKLRRCRLTAVSSSTSVWVLGPSSNQNQMIAACSVPMRIGHARLSKQKEIVAIQTSPWPMEHSGYQSRESDADPLPGLPGYASFLRLI
jgi:hypothetical protein